MGDVSKELDVALIVKKSTDYYIVAIAKLKKDIYWDNVVNGVGGRKTNFHVTHYHQSNNSQNYFNFYLYFYNYIPYIDNNYDNYWCSS